MHSTSASGVNGTVPSAMLKACWSFVELLHYGTVGTVPCPRTGCTRVYRKAGSSMELWTRYAALRRLHLF